MHIPGPYGILYEAMSGLTKNRLDCDLSSLGNSDPDVWHHDIKVNTFGCDWLYIHHRLWLYLGACGSQQSWLTDFTDVK